MRNPGPLDPCANGLLGHWKVEGVQLAAPMAPETPIRWTERFEWLEPGFFLLHRVQGHIGTEVFACTEVIANEEIHAFYNHGRHQVWSHWFEEDRWMIQGIWREGGHHHVRCTERFAGPDRRSSIWERSNASDGWEPTWRLEAVRMH